MRKPGLTVYEELPGLDRCPECRSKLVDAGGEVACPSCGLVLGTIQASRSPDMPGASPEALGSYVGRTSPRGERSPLACSTFGVTKLRADTIGRDSSLLQCSRLTERVSGRFFLPRGIVQNAIQTAGRLLPGRRLYGASMPAISAYSLLYACRAAGLCHIRFGDVLKAYAEAGHRISKSQMLRIGRESSLQLPAIRPEGMVRRAVAALQSDAAILDRLKRVGLDEGRYFASLLAIATAIATKADGSGGFSPRTLASGSVYLAARQLGPKAIRQKEAAETLGIAEYTVREFCSRFIKNQEAR